MAFKKQFQEKAKAVNKKFYRQQKALAATSIHCAVFRAKCGRYAFFGKRETMVVEVRRAEPSDAKAIKGIYECPNAYTGTLQLPLPSSDMWKKRFQNIPDHVYAYVALVDGEVVGNLGFELLPIRDVVT